MRLGAIVAGVIAVLIGLIFFGAFYTVDAGEKAVLLRNGAIKSVEGPGLHFKIPGIDSYATISMRTYTLPYNQEPFYSKDQQAATADVSITFRAKQDAAAEIYSQYGDLKAVADRILTPRVKKEFKEVMGQFNAATAIQEREKMGIEVAKAIIGDSTGSLIIESVQVENIDFSDAYEGAIESRMLAEVGIETENQNVLKEKKLAEIAVTQAQAVADSNFAKKKAEADGIKAIGDAEASALRAKGEALRDNPGLVALRGVELWNGALPVQMIPGSAVPFVNLNPSGN